MNKLIGYIIALAGLAVMALSFMKIPLPIPIDAKYLLIAGVIGVVVGVLLTLGKSSGKQQEEVPIYEGKGKERKIVGYQRMKK